MFPFATPRLPPLGDSPSAPPARRTPACRPLLALALVFAVLMTSSWTSVRAPDVDSGSRRAALQAWRGASLAGRPLPDPRTTPSDIRRFFAGLTEAQQRRLADRYPLVVGNLDGAPLSLRYHANRVALTHARERAHARSTDARLSAAGRWQAEERQSRFTSMLRDGRQFLVFDPTGAGRAAEVFGDLEAAERVSVVVPGAGTELLTLEREEQPYSAPAGMAKALYQRQRATAPDVRTAVVAWAGYTSPDGFTMDAATGELAADGARHLTSLLQGLPGDFPITLLCHSYGSVVCAMTADDGLDRVTDIAAAGSPGMRVDRVEDLRSSARVWALRSEDDWIADVPHLRVGEVGHGPDPVSSSFGARRLTADGVSGHRSYFKPGTGSLANLAAVGVGAYAKVDCATADRQCAVISREQRAGTQHETM